jgi:hypothetical protein
MAGKTGADAVSKAVSKICRVVNAYRVKLHTIIDAAKIAGIITVDEAAVAHAFVDSIGVACAIWMRIADYNSVSP